MIQMLRSATCKTSILWLALLSLGRGQELLVTPENGNGVYRPNQSIGWNVRLKGTDAAQTEWVVRKGGITEVGKGHLALSNGMAQVETILKEPGWLLLELKSHTPDGKELKWLGGAVVAPEKIQPAQPRPDDFDAFWETKLKDLAEVPMNAKTVTADCGNTNLDYFKVTLDNIRGTHVRGQLARPRRGDKLPAMLIVQWAGVYPLQKGWVTGRAAEGWLVLNINAHDLPIDEPEQFYKDQSNGPLKDYAASGNDDRDTSYFLRMYLGCYRAAQYLAERPDWDGRTLVVTGTSQGGMQSIITAALHPKITGLMACVPAGCDLNGPLAGRKPGWPMWYWSTQGKDEAKVRNADRYYDAVNFAPRVKCPALIAVGLIDNTCPPPGVYAAFNLFQGKKEMVVMPLSEHQDKNGSQAGYYPRLNAWCRALAKGGPPVPQ
jgi:cephalosporin-C deacetylase